MCFSVNTIIFLPDKVLVAVLDLLVVENSTKDIPLVSVEVLIDSFAKFVFDSAVEYVFSVVDTAVHMSLLVEPASVSSS